MSALPVAATNAAPDDFDYEAMLRGIHDRELLGQVHDRIFAALRNTPIPSLNEGEHKVYEALGQRGGLLLASSILVQMTRESREAT